MKKLKIRKDNIITKDNKKYILKKDHNHWVILWVWIIIAFLVCGVAFSEGKHAKEVKKEFQNNIDNIYTIINSYRHEETTEKDFNKILENYKQLKENGAK